MCAQEDVNVLHSESHHHDEDKADEREPDIHFEPVTKLEKVNTSAGEEDETPLLKMRAKLFRFDINNSEWKERGIGVVKFMMHKDNGKVRILMRREKTLKICCNHYLTHDMYLQPNAYSDRAMSWQTAGDYSDGEPKAEVLAIRFKTPQLCNHFTARFEECKNWNHDLQKGTKKFPGDAHPTQDPDAVDTEAPIGSDKRLRDDEAKAAEHAKKPESTDAAPAQEEKSEHPQEQKSEPVQEQKPEPIQEKKPEHSEPQVDVVKSEEAPKENISHNTESTPKESVATNEVEVKTDSATEAAHVTEKVNDNEVHKSEEKKIEDTKTHSNEEHSNAVASENKVDNTAADAAADAIAQMKIEDNHHVENTEVQESVAAGEA